MNRETYLRMTEGLRARPTLARAVTIANKAITYAIYVAYPAFLIWLFIAGSPRLVAALLVPLVSFVLLTFLRTAANAPRPYEVFDAPPVIAKDTKGKSFPSRHVFSIFVIGSTILATAPSPVPGCVILALGVALAAIRVVTGVHFPRDVVAGALIGAASGSLCFLF